MASNTITDHEILNRLFYSYGLLANAPEKDRSIGDSLSNTRMKEAVQNLLTSLGTRIEDSPMLLDLKARISPPPVRTEDTQSPDAIKGLANMMWKVATTVARSINDGRTPDQIENMLITKNWEEFKDYFVQYPDRLLNYADLILLHLKIQTITNDEIVPILAAIAKSDIELSAEPIQTGGDPFYYDAPNFSIFNRFSGPIKEWIENKPTDSKRLNLLRHLVRQDLRVFEEQHTFEGYKVESFNYLNTLKTEDLKKFLTTQSETGATALHDPKIFVAVLPMMIKKFTRDELAELLNIEQGFSGRIPFDILLEQKKLSISVQEFLRLTTAIMMKDPTHRYQEKIKKSESFPHYVKDFIEILAEQKIQNPIYEITHITNITENDKLFAIGEYIDFRKPSLQSIFDEMKDDKVMSLAAHIRYMDLTGITNYRAASCLIPSCDNIKTIVIHGIDEILPIIPEVKDNGNSKVLNQDQKNYYQALGILMADRYLGNTETKISLPKSIFTCLASYSIYGNFDEWYLSAALLTGKGKQKDISAAASSSSTPASGDESAWTMISNESGDGPKTQLVEIAKTNKDVLAVLEIAKAMAKKLGDDKWTELCKNGPDALKTALS